jgi:hypothetical protein
MTDNTEAMELWREIENALFDWPYCGERRDQAISAIIAAKLAELRARIEGLEGALDPFARVARIQGPWSDEWPDDKANIEFIPSAWPDWGDFKKARQALEADHGA